MNLQQLAKSILSGTFKDTTNAIKTVPDTLDAAFSAPYAALLKGYREKPIQTSFNPAQTALRGMWDRFSGNTDVTLMNQVPKTLQSMGVEGNVTIPGINKQVNYLPLIGLAAEILAPGPGELGTGDDIADLSRKLAKINKESDLVKLARQYVENIPTEKIIRTENLETAIQDLLSGSHKSKSKLPAFIPKDTSGAGFYIEDGSHRVAPDIRKGAENVTGITRENVYRLLAEAEERIKDANKNRYTKGSDGKLSGSKPITSIVDDVSDPLIQEARKYKSAEEFVKDLPKREFVTNDGSFSTKFDYGSKDKFGNPEARLSLDPLSLKDENGFITLQNIWAKKELRGKGIGEKMLVDSLVELKAKGINGIKSLNQDQVGSFSEPRTEAAEKMWNRIMNDSKSPISVKAVPSQTKNGGFDYFATLKETKSQLTDIWNKANKKTPVKGNDIDETIRRVLQGDFK